MKAAQRVIAESKNISGENKLRQKMIPQRERGDAPKILTCADGEAEGRLHNKSINFFAILIDFDSGF